MLSHGSWHGFAPHTPAMRNCSIGTCSWCPHTVRLCAHPRRHTHTHTLCATVRDRGKAHRLPAYTLGMASSSCRGASIDRLDQQLIDQHTTAPLSVVCLDSWNVTGTESPALLMSRICCKARFLSMEKIGLRLYWIETQSSRIEYLDDAK